MCLRLARAIYGYGLHVDTKRASGYIFLRASEREGEIRCDVSNDLGHVGWQVERIVIVKDSRADLLILTTELYQHCFSFNLHYFTVIITKQHILHFLLLFFL